MFTKKFILLYSFLLFVVFFLNYLLNIDDLIRVSYLQKMTSDQFEEIDVFRNKWQWLGYVFLLIYTYIKVLVIASILYIAIFFKVDNILFKNIWNIVLKAEFIFLLVPIFKIIWFYFFQTTYKLEDIQNFFPLSAINITGYEDIEPWYIYPLQTFNLFELAYVFYLGIQIAKLTKSTPDEGLKMVVFSYVPALLLWMCTIMFLILNYS